MKKHSPGAGVGLEEAAIRQSCKRLFLGAIASQFDSLAREAARDGHSHLRYLDTLLSAELEERGQRKVQRRIQEARLPRLKTLEQSILTKRRTFRPDSCANWPRVAISTAPSR